MIELGRLCIKTAGRDAGCKCVVIDILDNKFVLIDGQARRRKCNILHIEPMKDVISIKRNASHDEVKAEFQKLGIDITDTKPKQKSQKPAKKKRQAKEAENPKAEKAEKPAKKAKPKSSEKASTKAKQENK